MSHIISNLLTLQEAIELLGISRATFDRWKKERQLPYIKIGKEIFVDNEQLEHWIAKHTKSKAKDQETNTIHIGYQTGAALLWSSVVIKKLQLFEQQLNIMAPEKQFEVVWQNASNGVQLAQKFLAGSLDICAIGDYPIHLCFSLAKVFPDFYPVLIAFDGKAKGNQGMGLVQHEELEKEEVSLQVATVQSTSSSYHLNRYMKEHAKAFAHIHKPSMLDCMNSFLQHEVDAAMLWEPYLSWVEYVGGGKRLNTINKDVYLTGILTNADWMNKDENDQILTAYMCAHLIAHKMLRSLSKEAIEAVEKATKLPKPLIIKVIQNIRWDAAVYQEDLKNLNRISNHADENVNIRELLSTLSTRQPKISYEHKYLNKAVQQLSMPPLPSHCLTGEWAELCY